jgi:hypothetical protein
MSFQTLETDNYLLEKTDALVVEVMPAEPNLGIFFKQFSSLTNISSKNPIIRNHDWQGEPVLAIDAPNLKAKKVFLTAVGDNAFSSDACFGLLRELFGIACRLIFEKAKQLGLKKVLTHAFYSHYYHYYGDQIWCDHASYDAVYSYCGFHDDKDLTVSYAVDTISPLCRVLGPSETLTTDTILIPIDQNTRVILPKDPYFTNRKITDDNYRLASSQNSHYELVGLSSEIKGLKSQKTPVGSLKPYLLSQIKPGQTALSSTVSIYGMYTNEYLKRQLYAPCSRALLSRLNAFLGRNRLSNLRDEKEPEKTELTATVLALLMTPDERNDFFDVCSYHPTKIDPRDNFLFEATSNPVYQADFAALQRDYKMKFGRNFYSGKAAAKHKKVSIMSK